MQKSHTNFSYPHYDSHFFEVCTSTNQLACEALEKNLRKKTIFVAKRQTQGRGRLGRSWISGANNLAFSVALPCVASTPSKLSHMTLQSALCVSKACDRWQLPTNIKWPNDVLSLEGKKLAGILLESFSLQDSSLGCVIGIGLNLQRDGESDHLNAAYLSDFGLRISPAQAFDTLMSLMAAMIHDMENNVQTPWMVEYKKRSCTLGQEIRWREGNATLYGKAVDLAKDGSLIVEQDSKISKLYAGEIFMHGS